jgi:hypothetical protein
MVRGICAVVVTLAFAAPAGACSIAYQEPAQRLAAADRAVHTRVVSTTQIVDGEQDWQDVWEAKLRVLRVYKGPAHRFVRIRYSTDGGTCGLGKLEQGQRLTLLLHKPGPPFEASLGSRIPLTELHRAAGGKFRRPT